LAFVLDFRIRKAAVEDAVDVAALAERTFRATFSAENTPDDMDEHCRKAYSTDIQGAELASSDVVTLVCEVPDGTLIAYAQLRSGAPPQIAGPSPLELWRFYVDHAHHGQGVAQRLMAATIETATARGARTLWLGVWERNPRAQAFYRKMGFVDVGAHTFVVGSDAQTDRLMVLALDRVVR
jgi:ribosomal protein S18 acetylase RimI-like enzyme